MKTAETPTRVQVKEHATRSIVTCGLDPQSPNAKQKRQVAGQLYQSSETKTSHPGGCGSGKTEAVPTSTTPHNMERSRPA